MTETQSVAPLAQFKGAKPAAPGWFEAALANASVREHVTVGGAQIEMLTWGDKGKPGLLFLHGNGAHADWWSFIAPFFAATHRVAAMSWSGMGGSGWRDAYSLSTFVDETMAVAEAAGLFAAASRPVIVAHSFGGIPATATAARHGRRFAAVVLADTPFWTPERLAERKGQKRRTPMPTMIYPSLEAALERFRFLPGQPCDNLFIADFIARTSLRRVADPRQPGEAWTWRFDPFMWRDFEAGDRLADLAAAACPLALIWGSRSRLFPPDNLAFARKVMPAGAPMVEIPDAAHHLMVDQPLAFVATLRALLAVWPSATATPALR